MRLFLRRPDHKTIQAFIDRESKLSLTYSQVGSTAGAPPVPAGYVLDHNRILLGKGDRVWAAACRALDRWQMFEISWVTLCWPETPTRPGATVAVLAYAYGVWFLHSSQVVCRLEEADNNGRRYGFAYGTLPGHGARGEERFLIEQTADGRVWYDLLAFSRPQHWLLWVGYPLVRRLQKRFAQASLQTMRELIAKC
ncbi:MAG: DUF1990 domain-containing protein [Ardenticatenaceae bacterium]|nr:DUF1990 domain-containing protein [Ardenticatenaceae bacterium]